MSTATPQARKGFRLPRKVYVLDFEGTELEGIEVKAKSAPLGVLLQLGGMVDGFEGVPDAEAMAELSEAEQAGHAKGSMDALASIIDTFATIVTDWNVQDDDTGEFIAPDKAGLRTLDPPHLMLIIRAWMAAVSEVPAPLSEPSSSGKQLEALPLPMAPLSASQAS